MNLHYAKAIELDKAMAGKEFLPSQLSTLLVQQGHILLAGILLELAEANRLKRADTELAQLRAFRADGIDLRGQGIDLASNITPGAWGSQATAQEEPRP